MSNSKPTRHFLVRFADGTQLGPLDKSAVQKLVTSGRLNPEDLISQAGSERWIKASDVRGLFRQPATTLAHSDSEADQPSGIPRRLVWSLGGVGVLVIVVTVTWFFVSQRRLELNAKTLGSVQSAIASVEQADLTVPDDEVIQLADRALTLGRNHAALLDDRTRSSLEGVKVKLDEAHRRMELRSLFERLKSDISESSIPTVVREPPTGLFASDPAEAMRLWRKVVDWDADLAERVVKQGITPKELRKYLVAMQAARELTYSQTFEVQELLEKLGHPEIERPVDPADLRRAYSDLKAAFESRIADLLTKAESAFGKDASSAWSEALKELVNAWEKRCHVDQER